MATSKTLYHVGILCITGAQDSAPRSSDGITSGSGGRRDVSLSDPLSPEFLARHPIKPGAWRCISTGAELTVSDDGRSVSILRGGTDAARNLIRHLARNHQRDATTMTDPAIEIDYIGRDETDMASAGYVGEDAFAFTASGNRWEFSIADMEYSGEYDNARMMPAYVALELIADCIRRYIEGEQD